MREHPGRPRSGARRRALLLAAALAGVAVLFPAVALGPPQEVIRLTPPSIEMGAFYGGSSLRIEGRTERGCAPVVVVRGPEVKEAFSRKGRSGPIWVNAGKLEISGVPSLFLCFSPAPVRSLLSAEAVARGGLDEAALKSRLVIEPARMDHEVIREHYLKLKAEEGMLGVFPDGVQTGQPGESGVAYSVELQWPRKAPPGTYEVSVYECRDGAIIRHSTAPLRVTPVGFPAALGRLARGHGAAYGVIAVLIAAMAGFGMDFFASRLMRRRARVPLRMPVPEPQLAPEVAGAEPAADAAKAAAAGGGGASKKAEPNA